jgi:membrane protease YdiL (CAAX protease family)
MSVEIGGDPRGRRMTLFGAITWALTLLVGFPMCIAATAALREAAIDDLVNVTACQVLATSLVLFAIARVYAPTSSLRAAFGIRGFPAIDAPLAAVAGAGLGPLLEKLNDLVARRWPEDPKSQESLQALFAHSSPWTVVVCALVIPSIAQELFYRGALFEQLLRSEDAPLVVAATAILSGCSSLDPRLMPEALTLGLVLGWIRARSGSVWPPLVALLARYAVEALPILRGGDPAATAIVFPPPWIAGGAAAAVLALAAFAWRPPRRAQSIKSS